MKTCDVCGNEFAPKTSKKRCSPECVAIARRKKHPEYARRYYAKTAAVRTEYSRRYREENRDKCRETNRNYMRLYRLANPELYRAAARHWYESNREKARATNRRSWHKNRAKRLQECRLAHQSRISRLLLLKLAALATQLEELTRE